MSGAEWPERIDRDALDGLYGRDFLLTSRWSRRELEAVLELARWLRERDRRGESSALFRDQLFYALFFDQSTRTRASWAGASARLGAAPVIVDGTSTQVTHGETARETGAMLGMCAHALGIRHDKILGEGHRFQSEVAAGAREYLAGIGDERVVPVVNLQCDVDHPTQTMADLAWLRERLGRDLSGRRVAVTWAYSPSYAKPLSVPRGLVSLLPRFGAEVRLAHPRGYDLDLEGIGIDPGTVTICESMAEAFEGAHAVYPKSWGPIDLMRERVAADARGDQAELERIEAASLASNAEHRQWICDEGTFDRAADDALYLHCLPADIGAEVASGVLDRFRLDLARQANWKLYVISAVLAAAKHRDPVAALMAGPKEG